MRIDPTDTSIHDLTPKEAVELRALCGAMLSGTADLAHPMFVSWAATCCPNTQPLISALAFLPRALYALLLRAERGAMKHAKARMEES